MDVRELKDHPILGRGGERRDQDEEPALKQTAFDQASFGSALRQLRTERGWTLRDLSERSKISQSALSRVETGQITLSFDRAHALARALDADFSQLLTQIGQSTIAKGPAPRGAHGWRSVTRRGEGHHVTQPNADYEYLCNEFLCRKMVTIIAVITARSLEEHGPFVTHPGEEFVHVLEGSTVVATELYAPLLLEQGDSLQFDAMTPHAVYSETGGRVMFTITDPRWG
jgi:DNA-binding Xre family transcriptional regulator